MYVTAIIDICSKYIVGWSVYMMDATLVVDTLKHAVNQHGALSISTPTKDLNLISMNRLYILNNQKRLKYPSMEKIEPRIIHK